MNWLINKFSKNDNVEITGLTKELECIYILNKFRELKQNVLIVTNSLYECNKIYSQLSTYTEDVLIFPVDDFFSAMAYASSPDLKVKRLETMRKISDGFHIVVTNLTGYLKYFPNKGHENSQINIKINEDIGRNELVENLDLFGYSRDSVVTSTGNYAVRGFIIDVFLINEEHPIRIEFFGNTIESIRYFDENTQLSLENIKEKEIFPFNEIETNNNSNILDYLDNPYVFFFDYQQIEVGYEKLCNDILTYKQDNEIDNQVSYTHNLEDLNPKKYIYFNNINNLSATGIKLVKYDSSEMINFHSDFDLLKEKVDVWLKSNKTVIFYLSNKNQVNTITKLFLHAVLVSEDNIVENNVNIKLMNINKGFIFDNYVVISLNDIDENKNITIKYRNTLKMGKKINSLNNLKLGDYVVHRSHGIGIYNGVVTLNQRGIYKDFIQINYAGTDKVYIPVEKIDSIFKYNDSDSAKPLVNKLNSPAWEIKKRKVAKKIKDISEELMKLYAERNKIKGDKYIDDSMEVMFANEFPYEETKDQLKAINDIQSDLKKSVPMDRLLCGDVGFGKTEVAFRGVFKTIVNNKQVLYLCPTTILSKQQYNLAKERFANYPVEIALLNRFTSKPEAMRILEDLKNGKIDFLIGTHRLLSDDVKFKNLGLLVIDEEQRFGVTHKEKIKNLKKDVNVLTLSATPIPRTMKMAMSGLRDLSIIDTPPINRYPVQTYVLSENNLVIKDAIYKELARNGQIFVLYNRVAEIEEFCNKLRLLIPEARIIFAHGQMTKTELDGIMDDFVNYKYDILVCTTIIETGIDIPNANTLLIFDADRFGLSQLYQLRGRVGRSDRIAYAYLLYNSRKVLNDIAIKRLQAIKDFTELGSGYRIAMRDLSLRGAGDILGSEQAGFVDSVGIALYMKMVDEEISRLNGIEIEEDDDSKTLINVDTHIDDNYVSDEDVKIEIHQLINEVKDLESMNNIRKILEDRFGKISNELEIYMYEEWFEKLAKKLEITKVKQTDNLIEIELPEKYSNQIKGDKLFFEGYNINSKFKFKYIDKKIIISLPVKQDEKHFLYYLVELLEKINSDLLTA